jgi:hypothetical protein
VFAEPERLEAPQQPIEPIEMSFVQRAVATDRQPDTMDRQRPQRAHPFQMPQHRAAIDHVVLGMHFQKARAAHERRRAAGQQGRRACVLQAWSSAVRA